MPLLALCLLAYMQYVGPSTAKQQARHRPEVGCTRQVRQQLTSAGGPVKDRSSPYGTPKSLRSPIASPLISDVQGIAALDLNPGVTPVVRAFCQASCWLRYLVLGHLLQ